MKTELEGLVAKWRERADEQFSVATQRCADELAVVLAANKVSAGDGEALANGREVLAEMVRRFLSWRVPPDFAPDGGISFTPHPYPECWPIGTNLLTEPQAKAMFLQCLPAVAFECMEWKDRALAAEATIGRMADEFNRENGRTFMGEPVIPAARLAAQPEGVVADGNDPSPDNGFIVANGRGTAWRKWGDTGPEWTERREDALRFARRCDAESFCREDEDAWRIEPVGTAQPVAGSGEAVEGRYHELLYAVSRKHPGESRHQTALRYIMQAESQDHGPAQSAKCGEINGAA